MINLLPIELKQARLFGRRNRVLRNYSIIIFLIGFCSMAVMLLNSRLIVADEKSLRAEIAQKQSQAAELETKQKSLEKLAGDLKTIEQLYGGEVVFSQLLPQIGSLLPSGAVLNGLTLVGGKDAPLTLEIDIQSQELAAVFQQNLVNSELFDAADITLITSKSESAEQGTYAYSATITAQFKASKKPTTNTQTGGTN